MLRTSKEYKMTFLIIFGVLIGLWPLYGSSSTVLQRRTNKQVPFAKDIWSSKGRYAFMKGRDEK
jgi:hypothetical protein